MILRELPVVRRTVRYDYEDLNNPNLFQGPLTYEGMPVAVDSLVYLPGLHLGASKLIVTVQCSDLVKALSYL